MTQDLAGVLGALEELAGIPDDWADVAARLAAEPVDEVPQLERPLQRRHWLERAKNRATRALDYLGSPVPRDAAEARTFASRFWVRLGEPEGSAWVLALRAGEVFTAHPHQLRLSPDPSSRFFEPRLAALAAPDDLVASAKQAGGLWSVVQVAIDPQAETLDVVAGSRRVRSAHMLRRAALATIADRQGIPPVPRPLQVVVASNEADVYLADNLLGADETPWTTAARFLVSIERHGWRVKDLVERTGLSRRLVSYYVSLGGLAPDIFASGLRGELGLRLGAEVSQLTHEHQRAVLAATKGITPETARIAAIKRILGSGADLDSPIEVPDAPAAGGRVEKMRAALAACRTKQAAVVADFLAAAFDGDAEARGRLPAELQAVVPVTRGPARRPPPQTPKEPAPDVREQAADLLGAAIAPKRGRVRLAVAPTEAS